MVRLSDMEEEDRLHLLGKDLPPFGSTPWVTGPPLAERRVAIVTTAGLQRRGGHSFGFNDASYRVIPADTDAGDLMMSHSSVNFDRTGFQDDVNVVFPVDRLRELAAEGTVGSVADFHYSFMGAGLLPQGYEATAREVAGMLREDRVNAVFLSPV